MHSKKKKNREINILVIQFRASVAYWHAFLKASIGFLFSKSPNFNTFAFSFFRLHPISVFLPTCYLPTSIQFLPVSPNFSHPAFNMHCLGHLGRFVHSSTNTFCIPTCEHSLFCYPSSAFTLLSSLSPISPPPIYKNSQHSLRTILNSPCFPWLTHSLSFPPPALIKLIYTLQSMPP